MIVYVKFSSVGAGTVWGEGGPFHSGIEFGRSRTGEGSWDRAGDGGGGAPE